MYPAGLAGRRGMLPAPKQKLTLARFQSDGYALVDLSSFNGGFITIARTMVTS